MTPALRALPREDGQRRRPRSWARWWTRLQVRRWVRLYALAAGACDTTTGVLLVLAPAAVTALLGVPGKLAEPIFLRWIGVFVGGVGLAYLLPFLLGARPPGFAARLRAVFEVTALLRAAVALFVTTAVAAKALPAAWLPVAATDATLAAVQLAMIHRGVLDPAADPATPGGRHG